MDTRGPLSHAHGCIELPLVAKARVQWVIGSERRKVVVQIVEEVRGKSGAQLIELCIGAWTQPGDRIVLFGPAPPEHRESVLALEGRSYVDCGRNHQWSPRLDTLKMVLRDGARMVLVASPNMPTGTRVDWKQIEACVLQVPGVRLLVDERHEHEKRDLKALLNPSTFFLRKALGNEVCLYGSDLPFLDSKEESLISTKDEETSDSWELSLGTVEFGAELRLELSSQGFEVAAGVTPWAFVRKYGMDVRACAAELGERGYLLHFEENHVWRQGVMVLGRRK